ncbi:hypothetical protein EZ449_09265 [Pedobacter frigidisoli]|uniref:Uncharacterized protein n=1 Tax=Pedobacter frigidisoli TaxID=2530455 RepID=A0A4R0P1A1_9SPHI|nr:hypothetical protein EZ449_09265 [Pedobacter frigidisoli]
MRTGIILTFNLVSQSGVIKDHNDQKIRFRMEGYFQNFKRFDVVQYEISMGNSGLVAVDVKMVRDKRGEKVNLCALSN